jgi:hypothetical protein
MTMVTHLHLGDIRVGRGLATVRPGNLGFRFANFLASDVVGSLRHDDDAKCEVVNV